MTQKEALEILKMGYNVYLTGAAGSGKTYLLNQYISYLKEQGIVHGITASTGIAATHMNGRTIHSWAHLGIRDELTDQDLTQLMGRMEVRMKMLNTKVLIIDEVSMLHHFRLDMVDKVLRVLREDIRPFGGIQVILCGDLFQLPPVTRGQGDGKFIVHSEVWDQMDIKVCYLSEQHRQEDDQFLRILNEIRDTRVTKESVELLAGRMHADLGGEVQPTRLYTHNADVDAMNNAELDKLPGDEIVYKMLERGEGGLVDVLKNSCLAPEELRLKKDAIVMFVQNNFDRGYVNGTLGKIIGFEEEDGQPLPVVKTLSGKEITAYPGSWRIEEGDNTLAEINQIPLRLAWAITVHKSQGMSLDAAEIDLSRSFVPGMGYVALSRVRSLDGVRLVGINSLAMKVHPVVSRIDKTLKEESEELAAELKSMPILDKQRKQKEFLEACKV